MSVSPLYGLGELVTIVSVPHLTVKMIKEENVKLEIKKEHPKPIVINGVTSK